MESLNQRKFRRIDFRAPAVISHGSTTISGEVDNLCNTGIYIKTKNRQALQPNEDALVTICFTEGHTTMTVTMPAKVARTSTDGVAFHSSHISMYPILHLEHLFIYRKGKPDHLTEDFCEYISSMPLARSQATD